MNTLTTKLILASIVLSTAVAAIGIEPFDMHNTLPHQLEEYLEAKWSQANDDPRDRKDIGPIIEWETGQSSNDKETSNDVDTGNSQDCR